MAKPPLFATVGNEAEKIELKLSYGVVRLFSEGLYASPNKAVEELVANSFDAARTAFPSCYRLIFSIQRRS